jgi:hypothetical protein
LRRELAKIVNNVIDRLAEADLTKTPLAEEWASIANSGNEEVSFCETAARMGLDPYSVSDETADDIVNAASAIPREVLGDFFDSADASNLNSAVEWTREAILAAAEAAIEANRSLLDVRDAISDETASLRDALDERPWRLGYAMARRLRGELAVLDTDFFDVAPWVGTAEVRAPDRGLYGFATVSDDRCGVVFGIPGLGANTKRFGQARALGRILAHRQQRQFILSAVRSRDERVARAFAAELLAPAQGIRQMLEAIGGDDDSTLETIADRYRVSPLLVRHQYDNQIAA